MKIILFRRLEIKNNPDSIKRFIKTMESEIVPKVGDKYHEHHFGFFKHVIVDEVIVNYEKNEYHVLLTKGTIAEKNSDRILLYSQEMIENGWSVYEKGVENI
ncbi:hypothetical protein [Viridibacillus arvi]|uniref:hypothetical protein n=1 Tax=Viridibacillus arvi TaxID=263475 RepID=UPI003D2A7292